MVLSRVSAEGLKKAALYGAVLSVTGCSVLYYLIQSMTLLCSIKWRLECLGCVWL